LKQGSGLDEYIKEYIEYIYANVMKKEGLGNKIEKLEI
jgi:hypothetical protein